MAEAAHRRNITVENGGGMRKRGDRAIDARLAQQMQRRVGRTIGEVFNVVLQAAGKFVCRMQAGDLKNAVETQVAERSVGFGDEEIRAPEAPRTSASPSPWRVALVTTVLGAATGWIIDEVVRVIRGKKRR